MKNIIIYYSQHTHTHTQSHCQPSIWYARRQVPKNKNKIAKRWLNHPCLHFTQRRHRKINCTNWVTEFVKLVFSFSTFIRHPLLWEAPWGDAVRLTDEGRGESARLGVWGLGDSDAQHSRIVCFLRCSWCQIFYSHFFILALLLNTSNAYVLLTNDL